MWDSKTGFRLPKKLTADAAQLYEPRMGIGAEDRLLEGCRTFASDKGFLDKSTFLELAKWKSNRLLGHAAENSGSDVEEITRFALSTSSERGRITSLLGLAGVGWPMASVILHVCHSERYPILDVRALGTLGFKKQPRYNYTFWIQYVDFCRRASGEFSTDMRTFDRALFGWSRKHKLMAR